MLETVPFPTNIRLSPVDDESRVPKRSVAHGLEEALWRVHIHDSNPQAVTVTLQHTLQPFIKSPGVLQHIRWVRGLYLFVYWCGKIRRAEKALAVSAMEEVCRDVGKHLQKNGSHDWFH
jgi:hypothetical protein